MNLESKYAQLKAAAVESADIETVNELMIDILQSLHREFNQTSGRQRTEYEWAYGLLDSTLSAHQHTKQDTSNPYYVQEVSTQVGRDLERVLPYKRHS